MSAYAHTIPGGACWSIAVPAHRVITLVAQGASSNVSMLLFAADRLDRLNVPDTMKAQMSACIKAPMVLMSDRGTSLASVVSSSLDWHDCLGGLGSDAHLADATSYATHRNAWQRSARTMLLIEMAKYGLGEADLHAPVNWFSKVAIHDVDTAMTLADSHACAGDHVSLRTDQDVLVLVSTAPHAMSETGATDGVEIEIRTSAPSDPTDPSRLWREESARALELAALVPGGMR